MFLLLCVIRSQPVVLSPARQDQPHPGICGGGPGGDHWSAVLHPLQEEAYSWHRIHRGVQSLFCKSNFPIYSSLSNSVLKLHFVGVKHVSQHLGMLSSVGFQK